MTMGAIEKAEGIAAIAVVSAIGVILWKIYRSIPPSLTQVIDAPSNAIAGWENGGSVGSVVNNVENPPCDDPTDPLCAKRNPGTHKWERP